MLSTEPGIKKYWMRLGRSLLPGMGHLKDSLGIESMGKRFSTISRKALQPAFIVVSFFTVFFQVALSIALTVAHNRFGVGSRSTLETVRNAALNSLLGHLETKRKTVRVLAQPERVSGKTEVYNLTLEDDNVYFADGVMVENCADSLMMSLRFIHKVNAAPRRPQPIRPMGRR